MGFELGRQIEISPRFLIVGVPTKEYSLNITVSLFKLKFDEKSGKIDLGLYVNKVVKQYSQLTFNISCFYYTVF